MTFHGAFSLILNIRQGMKQTLLDKLALIDCNTENNDIIPFGKFDSIHFARFVVCDADTTMPAEPIPDRLVFTTNYDLPTDKHYDELISIAGTGLWDIFSLCDGFETGNYNADKLKAFFIKNNKNPETFYVGVGNRSVSEIRREYQLRNEIESYIDLHRESLLSQSALDIRKSIQEFITSNPSLAWVKNRESAAPRGWQLKRFTILIFVLILFVFLLPIVIPFVAFWGLMMLYIEIREKDVRCPINNSHIRQLVEREKSIVQNQFSAVGSIKPGWVRYQTMMFLLRMTNFLAPYLFSKGRLSGIPTVHFARWLIINNGRQMVFLSNFDGNSEGYLRDFIHIAAKQLTLMFTHTIGYPKTRFMIFGGAKDANGFMEWARAKQVITNVWYSAYPNVTVKNIFHNSKIRNGIYGDMNESQARNWLQLF